MPPAENVLQDPFFRALVASLALIVVADDEVHADEVATQRRVLEEAIGQAIPEDAIQRFAELARLKADDLKESVKARAGELSYDQKITVLTAASALVMADRKVHDEERKHLFDLAGCLGFERSKAGHFLDRARMKYRG